MWSGRTAALVLAAAVLSSCTRPRTEIVALIDSELPWGPGQRVQSVSVEVRQGDARGAVRSLQTTVLGEGGVRRALPLAVGLLPPEDGTDGAVWIEARGCALAAGCVLADAVVVQRAIVRFVPAQTVALPLLLTSACVGARCLADQRCDLPTMHCAPATGAQALLRPYGPVGTSLAGDASLGPDRPDVTTPEDHPDVVDVALAPTDDGVGVCNAGMHFIPAGQFVMGDPMADDPDARPVHGVRLSAFCMDETEVTVSSFAACVAAGSCAIPRTDTDCNWMVPDRAQHPVNCVDWSQSRAYCQWRGGDLPTEAQWEYAARGMGGRTYPWGEDAPGTQLCWSGGGTSHSTTCPVRSYLAGNSPFGLSDMAGNVWEWTLDRFGDYASADGGSYVLNPTGSESGPDHVFRGGSWVRDMPIFVRGSYRKHFAPIYQDSGVGLRCVRRAM